MKNKTKKVLCVASILGVVAISGIFAYLTDNESKENVFTVGKVDIELLEPSWPTEDLHGDAGNNDGPNGIPDAVENLVPNQFVAKDPQVKNVGKNAAYVFMRVQFKQENPVVQTCDSDGSIDGGFGALFDTVPTSDMIEDNMLSQAISRGWILLLSGSGGSVDEDGNIYTSLIFAYDKVLEPGQTTPALFDGIQIKNVTEAASGLEGCIKVDAFAIQKDGLPADIAEDLEDLEDLDLEDLDFVEDIMNASENYMAYSGVMGDVYDIIMNQNPDAQTTPYVPGT